MALIDARDALAKPPRTDERATLVLANPPFGRKSGFTTLDEFGNITREDVSYDRTECRHLSRCDDLEPGRRHDQHRDLLDLDERGRRSQACGFGSGRHIAR